MRKHFVSVKVWEKIFYLLFEKNFVSVKVCEKKFCKCKSVWENIL